MGTAAIKIGQSHLEFLAQEERAKGFDPAFDMIERTLTGTIVTELVRKMDRKKTKADVRGLSAVHIHVACRVVGNMCLCINADYLQTV